MKSSSVVNLKSLSRSSVENMFTPNYESQDLLKQVLWSDHRSFSSHQHIMATVRSHISVLLIAAVKDFDFITLIETQKLQMPPALWHTLDYWLLFSWTGLDQPGSGLWTGPGSFGPHGTSSTVLIIKLIEHNQLQFNNTFLFLSPELSNSLNSLCFLFPSLSLMDFHS